MKKNNKGFALFYTVMIMIIVFAICALITTDMLAEVTYISTYSENSYSQRICTQIADIWLSSETNLDADLEKYGFKVEIIDSNNRTVEYEDNIFKLKFMTIAEEGPALEVSDENYKLMVIINNQRKVVRWEMEEIDA